MGGRNILQTSIRKLSEEFTDENEPWLLIGIPSRDSSPMMQYLERHFVSSDQHVKDLMPPREGLHVTTRNATCDSTMHVVIQHRGENLP